MSLGLNKTFQDFLQESDYRNMAIETNGLPLSTIVMSVLGLYGPTSISRENIDPNAPKNAWSR